ncbi:MAG: hypothetical protein MUQ26_08480 [Armatimonadetes bacterium]|nr:hypothetical protein [Armatimonadota bacterium]
MSEGIHEQTRAMAARPEALLTITVDGWDQTIVRRGAFEDLIGSRSVEGIITRFLDTGILAQAMVQGSGEAGRREGTLGEAWSLRPGEYSVSVRRARAEDGGTEKPERPVPYPADEQGIYLATRMPVGPGRLPCYSLHLHLRSGASARREGETFDERLRRLKHDLRLRIEALDFSGLFRGNRHAEGDALRRT